MFTIIIAILIKIITVLGIAALVALILTVARILLGMVFEKIQAFLRKVVGGKIMIVAANKLAREVNHEIERKGNVYSLTQLKQQLQGEGVVLVGTNANGELNSMDDLKIIKSEEMDPQLRKVLDDNEGSLSIKT